jgi:hypothetical protein
MYDRRRYDVDLNDLLHPGQAFGHPCEVLNDPDLTLNEKRAILASWASDACAIEAAPELRSNPQGTSVPFDEIMEALRTLDRQTNGHRYRRVFHQRDQVRHWRPDGESNTGSSIQ